MSIISRVRQMRSGAHYFSMRTREALFVVLVRTRPYREIRISRVVLRKGPIFAHHAGSDLLCEDE
jgi:hypothetical protein